MLSILEEDKELVRAPMGTHMGAPWQRNPSTSLSPSAWSGKQEIQSPQQRTNPVLNKPRVAFPKKFVPVLKNQEKIRLPTDGKLGTYFRCGL